MSVFFSLIYHLYEFFMYNYLIHIVSMQHTDRRLFLIVFVHQKCRDIFFSIFYLFLLVDIINTITLMKNVYITINNFLQAFKLFLLLIYEKTCNRRRQVFLFDSDRKQWRHSRQEKARQFKPDELIRITTTTTSPPVVTVKKDSVESLHEEIVAILNYPFYSLPLVEFLRLLLMLLLLLLLVLRNIGLVCPRVASPPLLFC